MADETIDEDMQTQLDKHLLSLFELFDEVREKNTSTFPSVIKRVQEAIKYYVEDTEAEMVFTKLFSAECTTTTSDDKDEKNTGDEMVQTPRKKRKLSQSMAATTKDDKAQQSRSTHTDKHAKKRKSKAKKKKGAVSGGDQEVAPKDSDNPIARAEAVAQAADTPPAVAAFFSMFAQVVKLDKAARGEEVVRDRTVEVVETSEPLIEGGSAT